MRLFSQAQYRFIEKRRGAYFVSGTVIAMGIATMFLNVASLGSWLNYGVDFLGGSLIQVRFEQQVTAGELRDALGGSEAPPITQFGSENEFVIRAPLSEDASITEVAEQIESDVTANLPNSGVEVVRTELVGAKVGGELQTKALLAVLLSFLLTLVYIAVRFEFRFGLAAVIATAHDILITLGFLAAFRTEISLPTVAAILTILGYSLNDTIVVFDRVRENMKAKGGRKRDPIELVNASINETLPRTVLTSGTTLAVLTALLVLGGAVIRDFTIVLILGVVIGTYSSIFVASPALIEIQNRWGVADPSRKKKERPRPATV
ncbi:MAG TPA: protein translocase subunit SecF [Gemmatimonadetes bacterium]|nr:protein translocase subunit SecF [Gemmatimonadota bacterium]|tara:strand:- start:663 stop:1622 length:960 start_codon:yes stop_codon:yes gene_type:complete